MTDGFKLLGKYRRELMGFAALWVLMFHLCSYSMGNLPDCVRFTEFIIIRLGYVGVDIFLLVSGMGLTFAYSKWQGYLHFYKRRLIRILPQFLIFSVLLAICEKSSFVEFIEKVTGYGFYFKYMQFGAWYITAILTFYLFFPFYYKLFLKSKSPVLFTLGSIAIWYLISLQPIIRVDLYGFTNRIPIFLTGILIGYLAQNKEYEFTKWSYLAFALMLCIGFYTGYLVNVKGKEILMQDSGSLIPAYLLAVGFSFLIPKFLDMLSSGKGFVKRIGSFICTCFGFLGGISLELYLFPQLLDFCPFFELPETIPTVVSNVYKLILGIVVAWLFSMIIKGLFKLFDMLKLKFQKA